MKAFSSIRREFKALYKPRPASISGKEIGTPLELGSTSRSGSAPSSRISEWKPAESDDHSSHTQSAHEIEHVSSSRHSTIEDEDQAPANTEIVSSPSKLYGSDVGEEPARAADIPLSDSAVSEDPNDSSEPHGEVAEVLSLTFGEAQALRDKCYIIFETEDEGDYTPGPARFVPASDGVQECAALLMTPGLSTQLQRAFREYHAFEQAQLAGLRQRQAFVRFENQVEAEIANCRSKIAAARDVDPVKEAAVQDQLEIFTLLLEDVQSRRQTVNVHLETQAGDLRNTQAAANALIEEAFVCANLIAEGNQVEQPVIEELDLETEYAAFCERLKHADDDDGMVPAAPPLDTSRDYEDEIPVLTEDERAHQDIINDLWTSKETLDQARRDFEEREILRAQEYQANVAAYERNEPTADDTPEAFDVRWVKRFGELTRALIDAESAYAEVKRTAFEAGIQLPFMDTDNDTIFEGSHHDGVGYTVSKEQELVASAPSPTVRQWLSKVPEDVSVGSPAYAPTSASDEWEAEEVGISDSVSLVAEGKERVRIDRWRKACGAQEQE